ncbi:DUF421 domain-containing protein [Luteolibacter flavescens]|uniref:DUF421 domain-containing protein n=1 Tax=Luteolibacter flavescens TaxID=1859460 RepID=A0ABT3FR33_9BACT|nr:YetF domain-containing protein [Luteolibacter flavescens]MCW1886025.1 DUF421 domain-containing protein [Luteolibacter flavescens]
MEDLFFKDWQGLRNTLVCATAGYLSLFAFIRISGKRTLAKLNAFDFVVAVTLGSTLSSMILAKVPIAEGLLAVAVIIALQFVLAKAALESPRLEKVINSRPSLLFYEGSFMEDAMQREVITKEEILAAVRSFRVSDLAEVQAVVMELNGDLTVVRRGGSPGSSSLVDILDQADRRSIS